MMVQFDWTISVGNLLTVIIIGGGWIAAFYSLKTKVEIMGRDLKSLDFKQTVINESLIQLTQILIKVSVQDERLNSFEHRISAIDTDVSELRHGKGFVVDGEYSRHGRTAK